MALIRANAIGSELNTATMLSYAAVLPFTASSCKKGDIVVFEGNGTNYQVPITNGTIIGGGTENSRFMTIVKADADGDVVIGGSGSVSGVVTRIHS
ncbi:MAG: hypothetical protein J6X56_04745 [Ruminococcus sp.]|nr:hypothetical protein [Ruminococcus sp.]